MKVYHNINEFEYNRKVVLTTGTFDGVHIGHQKIIQRVKLIAENNGLESVILTFFPHPRMVLFPDDNQLRLLNTIEAKTELFRAAGIDHLIIHPFSKAFSRNTPLQYVRDILVNQLGVGKMVIGYDHHFGKNREGNLAYLKECAPTYGFDVEEISAQEIEHVNVSSTKIRKALTEGDVVTAMHYLGYSYKLTGKVIHGKGLGKELTYPTANIEVEQKYKLIPAIGIYAVYVKIGNEEKKGMLSIGNNPTIPNADFSIEVNIFDFDEDIYDNEITISFIERIRDEIKFDGLEELKEQLGEDKKATLKILN